jgi:hypothetical protein
VAVGVRVALLLAVAVEVGAIEGVTVIEGVAALVGVAVIEAVPVFLGVAVLVCLVVALGDVPKNEPPDDPLHPAVRSKHRRIEEEAVFRHQFFTLLFHHSIGVLRSLPISKKAPGLGDYIAGAIEYRDG